MKIWDLPTRLYHWLQAIVFILLLITGLSGNGPHIPLGILLFSLIVWRLMWGVFGSETSKFSQFVKSPRAVLRYLSSSKKHEIAHAGHNPLGALMVIGLLLTLLLQCLSGLVLAGIFDGLPYAELLLSDNIVDIIAIVHWVLIRILMALVVMHILAIAVYKLKGKPLLMAMFTGINKQLHQPETVKFASNRRALLLLIGAGLVTMAIITASTLYALL